MQEPIGPQNGYQLYAAAQSEARARGEGHLFEYPANFRKTGPVPDLNAPDVARLVAAAVERKLNLLHAPGMAVTVVTTQHADTLYVSFAAPDPWHPHQWFFEASGQGLLVKHTDPGDPLGFVISRMDYRSSQLGSVPTWGR